MLSRSSLVFLLEHRFKKMSLKKILYKEKGKEAAFNDLPSRPCIAIKIQQLAEQYALSLSISISPHLVLFQRPNDALLLSSGELAF